MSGKFQSIFLGALVGALVSLVISIGAQYVQAIGYIACCLPGILIGMLAVWHYTSTNELTIKAGEGAGIGAVAGLVGAILGYILSVVSSFFGLLPNPFDPEAVAAAQRRAMESNPNLTQEQIDQALEMSSQFSSPTALLLFALGGVLVTILIGAAGGAIGASLFKKGGELEEL